MLQKNSKSVDFKATNTIRKVKFEQINGHSFNGKSIESES